MHCRAGARDGRPYNVPMKRVLGIAIAATLLGACAQDEPPPEPKQPEGRAETRAIRNTDAIGYSGSAVADKVDDALNKNDEEVRQAEQQSAE